MKTIETTITVYKFNELSEKAQKKAVGDYIEFIINTTDFDKLNKKTNLYKAFAECEKMKTPWFIGQYIWMYCQTQIKKELEKSTYFYNGEIFLEV